MPKNTKTGKGKLADKGMMIIGTLVICLLCSGSIFLSIKYIKEYNASKNYQSAVAYVVGDISTNTITKKDDKGNITSQTTYYDYTYEFEVDGQVYSGEKNNVEDYYGDSFEVLYDENNPGKFIIKEEASFPVLLCLVSLGLAVASVAGIVKTIKD